MTAIVRIAIFLCLLAAGTCLLVLMTLGGCSSTRDFSEPVILDTEQMIPQGSRIAEDDPEGVLELPDPVSVYFNFASYELTREAKRTLLAFIDQMRGNEPEAGYVYTISVVGHADPRGPEGYNYELGRQRAISVSDFLYGNGMAHVFIIVDSKGEADPVPADTLEEANRLSRRVDVIVKKVPIEYR